MEVPLAEPAAPLSRALSLTSARGVDHGAQRVGLSLIGCGSLPAADQVIDRASRDLQRARAPRALSYTVVAVARGRSSRWSAASCRTSRSHGTSARNLLCFPRSSAPGPRRRDVFVGTCPTCDLEGLEECTDIALEEQHAAVKTRDARQALRRRFEPVIRREFVDAATARKFFNSNESGGDFCQRGAGLGGRHDVSEGAAAPIERRRRPLRRWTTFGAFTYPAQRIAGFATGSAASCSLAGSRTRQAADD